jgi:hypothetical protein
MGESLLPIRFPTGGLSETMAYSDQEEATAREFQNMRVQDPITRRLRGAQRSGLSKYMNVPAKAVGTKVQDVLSFFVDNRQVTYTAATSGSETETWDEATPGGGAVRNLKIDRQGNRYALSGNSGIVKFSADGSQVWQLAVPVGDTNHIIRALWVDEEDLVFVGVSSGGAQTTAKLFCFEQTADNKTEKLWEITPGSYIEDVLVSQGYLYTCQNETDRCRAWVRVYDFFDTANPEKAKEWRVPYPVNSITVKKDGSVIVACEPSGDTDGFRWRLPDPRSPEFSVDSTDWTPYQLEDFDKRVWSWYVADDIDQTDVADDIEEGVEILQWRDRTKNNRHWYAALDEANTQGPLLARDAICGHQAVRFSAQGTINATNKRQALKTLRSSTYSTSFADQQRQAIPSYTNSAFALYIVCRPSQSDVDTTTSPMWLFGQDRDNASSGADANILFLNASDANGNTLPPTTSAGGAFWYQGESALSGGAGTGSTINSGFFTTKPDGTTANEGNFCIVSMVSDGNVSNTTVNTQVSLYQINGNPIDKFQARASFSLEPSYLGVVREFGVLQPNTTAVVGYLGDIVEIICLDRRSRTTTTDVVLTYDNLENGDTAQSQTVNEHTLIVGYLAHKYGAQKNLPYGTATTNNFPHPFGITGSTPDFLSGPPNQAGTGVSTAQAYANKRYGAVVKYNAEGKIKWCANEQELSSGSRTGGYGYAVAVNSDGNIYSLGPNPTGAAGGTEQVRLIIDQGDDFSIATADGAWSASYPSNYEQTYKYPRIAVDEFDNLYTPFPANSGNIAGFRVYKKDGTVLHSGTTGAETESYCVAVDRRIPDYRTDLTTKRAEFIAVGTNQAEIDLPNVHNVRLVNSAQSGASPRTLTTMAVSGGDIVKFTTSGTTAVTGGTGALDSAAYVQSTTLFKNVYWTDGRQYKEYHPVTNEVVSYKCTSAGQMPSKCALMETWRGRIVLARSADEPHNWFLSKKDEPNNWDFFPAVPGETDAVAGNNSPAGLCPDIINSVVPYSEDILVFGGDHSIWALVGDPAAGGRLELVSDVSGMSFGRPWCKDPNGVLYFFGSQGGIFRWVPGSRPERVSVNKIERQLQEEVDLSTHYIRLVYNYKDEGIHILQCPFGAGGTTVSHWFLELNTDSFALDKFGTTTWTNVQPTAVTVVDGDEFDDRSVLFGCEDGYIRRWDKAAKSDDTRTDGVTHNAIDAFFTLFPLNGGTEEATAFEVQFSGLTVVLDPEQDGARFELYASETPESLGVARRMGDLVPGRNPPKWDRVTGPYCGLRIRNAAPEQRFAWERGYLRISSAGPARARSL